MISAVADCPMPPRCAAPTATDHLSGFRIYHACPSSVTVLFSWDWYDLVQRISSRWPVFALAWSSQSPKPKSPKRCQDVDTSVAILHVWKLGQTAQSRDKPVCVLIPIVGERERERERPWTQSSYFAYAAWMAVILLECVLELMMSLPSPSPSPSPSHSPCNLLVGSLHSRWVRSFSRIGRCIPSFQQHIHINK